MSILDFNRSTNPKFEYLSQVLYSTIQDTVIQGYPLLKLHAQNVKQNRIVSKT